MNSQKDYGKIRTNPGWLACPVCGKPKIIRVLPDTQARNLPVFCKRCGKESIVNIPQEPEP